jgi:hypothetical protein
MKKFFGRGKLRKNPKIFLRNYGKTSAG